MAEPRGWSIGQRRLHWWTALLVATGFALAWIMVAVPLRDLLTKFLLYQAHKTLGLLVLALTLVRLALRARRGRPAFPTDLASWRRPAAASVQAILYALLVITPLLGYLTAATAPIQVPTLFLLLINVPHVVGPNPWWFAILRSVHQAFAITLVALAGGHAAAAFQHHRNGQPLLLAMWRG